jgi:hypothetical protein
VGTAALAQRLLQKNTTQNVIPAQQRRKIDDFAVLFGCSKAGMVGASSLGVGGHAESTT